MGSEPRGDATGVSEGGHGEAIEKGARLPVLRPPGVPGHQYGSCLGSLEHCETTLH
jgi:hypothetical protein